MSFRSNHTIHTIIENKRFSFRQGYVENMHNDIYQPSQSSSESSYQEATNNFNSGRSIQNIQVSSSRKSTQSENETQSFIKAQFKPSLINKKIQDFKLFPQNNKKQNQNQQFSNKNNAMSNNQNMKRKETYDTAYFQISLQDQPQIQNKEQKEITQKQKFLIQIPQKHINQMQQIDDKEQNGTKFHFFKELQVLQKTIMKTLKQKQKNLQVLVKQIEHHNDEKMHVFKTNKRLQNQLSQLRQKSKQNSIQNQDWKPKNIDQLRLQMDNEKLNEELKKLEEEQLNLKKMEKQSKEEEKLLKESLKSALKTRKKYAKGIIKSTKKAQGQYKNYHHQNQNPNLYLNRRQIQKNEQKSYNKKHRTISKTQNKNAIKAQINQSHSKIKHATGQLNQLEQKQLLIRLLNDFNDLKTKVDQSLYIRQKSTITKNQSTKKKHNRKAIIYQPG